MIRLATVFSGIGAIEYTLNSMGWEHEIVFAGDIDPLCKQSYFANYKINEENWHTDIRRFDANQYNGLVDLLVGGSPCQAFSTNGKRQGFEDDRGSLFYEFLRVVKQSQPKVFIFENVRGLLIHDGGKTWKKVKEAFLSLNYDIYINKNENGEDSPLLNAADYGIPQNRFRLYVVGIKKSIQNIKTFEFPKPIKLSVSVKDFLLPNAPAKYYLGEKGFKFVTTHPTRAQVNKPIMKCQKRIQQYNWNGDFVFEPLYSISDESVLDKAYVGEFMGEKGVIRKIRPVECLKLMGYDIDFVMLHNDVTMYNQIGNSIVINVLKNLLIQLNKTGVFVV